MAVNIILLRCCKRKKVKYDADINENADNPGIVVILMTKSTMSLHACNGVLPGLAQGIKILLV